MFKNVYLVINMQPGFCECGMPHLAKVLSVLQISTALSAPVLFLEMAPDKYGKTSHTITERFPMYHQGNLLVHTRVDASALVSAFCRSRSIVPDRFIVCGMRTDGSVRATVNGLLNAYPKVIIEVERDGCHTCNCSEEEARQLFPRHQNLYFVK